MASRLIRHGEPGLSCSQGAVPLFNLFSRHHLVTSSCLTPQSSLASLVPMNSLIVVSFYRDVLPSFKISRGGVSMPIWMLINLILILIYHEVDDRVFV